MYAIRTPPAPMHEAAAAKIRHIRAQQQRMGEAPCFATDARFGCQARCPWRTECLRPIAAWLR